MGLGCGCLVCFLNKMGKNRGNRPCRNMAMCRNSHLRIGYERVIAIHGNNNSRTSWISQVGGCSRCRAMERGMVLPELCKD